MTRLKNAATGHEITTDAESVEFWQSAGYRAEKPAPKKAPAKKSDSK